MGGGGLRRKGKQVFWENGAKRGVPASGEELTQKQVNRRGQGRGSKGEEKENGFHYTGKKEKG